MKNGKKAGKNSPLKLLDYLLIPTNWERQRKKRAIEELKKREIENILVLNGFDSEDDILYLGKKLKNGERIGFVTFPLHYQEYEELIKKAQAEKKFPKKIFVENIKTKQTPRQFIYGMLAKLDNKFLKKGDLDYFQNRPENFFLAKLRRLVRICLMSH